MSHLFDDLKKKEHVSVKKRKVRFVLLGSDFPTLILFRELLERYGEENVLYLCEHEISEDDFIFPGPGPLRGEENALVMHTLFPQLQIVPEKSPALYYRDQTFRPIESIKKRSHLPFLHQEEYFAAQRLHFNLDHLVGGSWQQLFSYLKEKIKICELQGITKIDPPQEGTFWEVLCQDGETLQCEYLVNSLGNKRTHQLLRAKEKYSTRLHEYLQKQQSLSSMVFMAKSDTEVTPESGTIFVPQNTTVERGHFIGEFSPYQEGSGEQHFTFFTYLEDEQMHPEELSKKIKSLKRSLKRIFPQSKNKSFHLDERIVISDKNPCQICHDELFDKIQSELPHMVFLGTQAPLSKKFMKSSSPSFPILENLPRENIVGLARAMLSLHHTQQVISQA